MRKLFYGLPIYNEAATRLFECVTLNFADLSDDFKWATLSNYHITLCFIGFVKAEDVAAFSQVIREKIRGIRKFPIYINKIQRFPDYDSSVIAGCCEPTASMSELFSCLNNQAHQLGASPDSREFKPHITIGITKADFLVPFESLIIEEQCIEIKEVVLYESIQTPLGNDYYVIERNSLL